MFQNYFFAIFSADPYLYVFLGGLLEVPAYVLLWPAIVYIGRTKSLAILYGICGVTILIVMVLLLYAPQGKLFSLFFQFFVIYKFLRYEYFALDCVCLLIDM